MDGWMDEIYGLMDDVQVNYFINGLKTRRLSRWTDRLVKEVVSGYRFRPCIHSS